MSAAQALEILGLELGATEKEIRAAYNRLMQKVHPDVGGSNFFAKQLNAARDVLLGRAR
jgi:type IV secretion system protein VirD4